MQLGSAASDLQEDLFDPVDQELDGDDRQEQAHEAGKDIDAGLAQQTRHAPGGL